jgi:hypothetical protein
MLLDGTITILSNKSKKGKKKSDKAASKSLGAEEEQSPAMDEMTNSTAKEDKEPSKFRRLMRCGMIPRVP